jgi:biopolymer transport protein ExbB/TolQ
MKTHGERRRFLQVDLAFGLLVGIPAPVMYRPLLARIDDLVLALEDEAALLIETLAGKQ